MGTALIFAYMISYAIRYGISVSVTGMLEVAVKSNDSAHYLVSFFQVLYVMRIYYKRISSER